MWIVFPLHALSRTNWTAAMIPDDSRDALGVTNTTDSRTASGKRRRAISGRSKRVVTCSLPGTTAASEDSNSVRCPYLLRAGLKIRHAIRK